MLTKLVLDDFKSFRHAELRLSRLTLLVGANASGKSNVFDALQFMQGLTLGMPLADVLRGRWEGGREIWPGIRGGPGEIARHGTQEFKMASYWTTEKHTYEHELACSLVDTPSISTELFNCDNQDPPILKTPRQEGISPKVAAFVRGTGGIRPAFRHQSHSFLAPPSLAYLDDKHISPVAHETVHVIREALRGTFLLDINPRRMRDYGSKSSTQLGSEGQNISAAVWQLCQEEGRKQDLLDWMSELCAPELSDVDFVETELGDVMLVLVENDGARISARSLSDGTLRFLGELTALLTVPHGSLILIEEIETGLHPTRIHLLVELLTGLTREREVQILATTHSPAVLSALTDADPDLAKAALVFGRTPDEPGTIARRLGDLPHFDEVVQRRGIEHLFTTQWLERAL